MKKTFFILISLFVLLNIGTCFASEFETDNSLFVDSGEESDNQFSGEENLFENIDEKRDKNIVEFGDIVTAKGIAKDLLILAGATINQEAVGDYAFIAGQNLNVSGDISKDAFLIGGKSVNIDGNISRDAYVVGQNIIITGRIGRDTYLFGDEILITESAVIEGDILLDGRNIQINDGATISGTITHKNNVPSISIPDYVKTKIIEAPPLAEKQENSFKSSLVSCIIWLVSNIILFAITMLIVPKLFEKIKTVCDEKGGGIVLSTLGFGILLLVAIPIIAIFAMLTIIGCSIGIIGFLVYFIIMMYSTVLTGYLIGVMIFKKSDINKYLVGIIGITIVQILRILPYIGVWVALITFLISLGLIVEVAKKQNKTE